jgi:hypothetical protein
MTLTVRLPAPLEEALGEYAASQGLSKSHVVQEALADYLARTGKDKAPANQGTVSETYAAFKKLGLIGCVPGEGVAATKEVVRERIVRQLQAKPDARR